MMNGKRQKFLTRVGMLALAVFLALPLTAFAQDNNNGVQRRIERIERTRDNDQSRRRDSDRNRDNDEWRRQEERRRQEALQRQAELRRQEELRRLQAARNRNNDDWRRRNDDNNDRNRRGRNWGGYGTYGGSSQLRQTALNAGYNNGIQEGRKDRSRSERLEYRDEGDYQNATEDYNSRYGNQDLYRRYFREGFANGYRDGYNGY